MSRAVGLPLACLLLSAGFAIRLWGMEQGYPGFYGHVDEIGVAASIWNFFRSATLMPTEFTYPAFFSYLVAGLLWAISSISPLPEMGNLLDEIALVSYLDPARVVLVGRAWGAIASSLTILLTYVLGCRAFNRSVGLLAALFVAFSVVSVTHAHRALPDSTMALLAAVCFYCSWNAFERGRWSDYLLAGVAAGLVVATKYNGAFASLAILAAHLVRSCDRTDSSITRHWRMLLGAGRDPKIWAAVAVAFASLFVGSPYLIIARDQYAAIASYQISSLDFDLGRTRPWWWILEGLIDGEYAVGALMIVGIGWAIYRRHPFDWLFLAAWVPTSDLGRAKAFTICCTFSRSWRSWHPVLCWL